MVFKDDPVELPSSRELALKRHQIKEEKGFLREYQEIF